MPASLATGVLWDLYAAHERPRKPMIVTLFAVGVNVVLDYVLILGIGSWPGLGLFGAALATSLTALVHFPGSSGPWL